jgi:SAM-dependent methyltransferase
MSTRDAIRRQFGRSAGDYVTSESHSSGDDLDLVAHWLAGETGSRALDIATGGGHMALALARVYPEVVASDITDEMLAAAASFIRGQGFDNVTFVLADAENLPFAGGEFDCVSCRIAPHHFPDVGRFVHEVFRVLAPGGIFILIDSVAPQEPATAAMLNQVETLRDPTHNRTLPAAEWLALMAQAGFVVEEQALARKRHDLVSWFDRSRTPDSARRQVLDLLASATPDAVTALGIESGASGPVSFEDEKAVVRARRPGPS